MQTTNAKASGRSQLAHALIGAEIWVRGILQHGVQLVQDISA